MSRVWTVVCVEETLLEVYIYSTKSWSSLGYKEHNILPSPVWCSLCSLIGQVLKRKLKCQVEVPE